MYKELINELSKDSGRAVPQKPAALSEIREAEEIVGCCFPAELRELLTEMNGDRWLLFSTGEIKEVALSTREYLSESFDDIDKHIFFGSNGCGDYYCYNITGDGSVDLGARAQSNASRRVEHSGIDPSLLQRRDLVRI